MSNLILTSTLLLASAELQDSFEVELVGVEVAGRKWRSTAAQIMTENDRNLSAIGVRGKKRYYLVMGFVFYSVFFLNRVRDQGGWTFITKGWSFKDAANGLSVTSVIFRILVKWIAYNQFYLDGSTTHRYCDKLWSSRSLDLLHLHPTLGSDDLYLRLSKMSGTASGRR